MMSDGIIKITVVTPDNGEGDMTFPQGPVHWLENVGGDANCMRTVCGKFTWTLKPDVARLPLDPNRTAVHTVTCPECLAVMADRPTIVEVRN